MSLAAEGCQSDPEEVVCMAGTGMGNAITFWIPLLFRSDGIQIVVRSLNCLGQQDVTSLAEVGIRAVSIGREAATPAIFHVSLFNDIT